MGEPTIEFKIAENEEGFNMYTFRKWKLIKL